MERRAKRDQPVGGNHLHDVGGGKDQQSRASLAGAHDDFGDASDVKSKLFDQPDRPARRVDSESDAARQARSNIALNW